LAGCATPRYYTACCHTYVPAARSGSWSACWRWGAGGAIVTPAEQPKRSWQEFTCPDSITEDDLVEAHAHTAQVSFTRSMTRPPGLHGVQQGRSERTPQTEALVLEVLPALLQSAQPESPWKYCPAPPAQPDASSTVYAGFGYVQLSLENRAQATPVQQTPAIKKNRRPWTVTNNLFLILYSGKTGEPGSEDFGGGCRSAAHPAPRS